MSMELESMTMTRRTELGSCSAVQRSDSPAHFFKFILAGDIHVKEMRIPKEFIRRFGREISREARISVPDGRVWTIGLKNCDEDVWFGEGWPEFAKHYSLGFGSLVWFEYKGKSELHVFICDASGAEIYYPSKAEGPSEKFRQDYEIEDEVIDVDNFDLPSRGKKQGETQSRSRSGDPFSRTRISSRLHQGVYEKRRSKRVRKENEGEVEVELVDLNVRARARANSHKTRSSFRTENPHFSAVIKPFNICCAFVYVPTWFAKEYLSGVISLHLENSINGKRWKVGCHSPNSRSSALRIGKGWKSFARDNHLQEGDVCVFELIKRKQVVIQVTIYHVAEAEKERAIKPKNPHFHAAIKSWNMYNAFVYVPAWFAKQYLRGVVRLNLENSNGKRWKVACRSAATKSSASRIGQGWTDFARDSRLQEGDVCVFELIKRKPVVLQVTIFPILSRLKLIKR